MQTTEKSAFKSTVTPNPFAEILECATVSLRMTLGQCEDCGVAHGIALEAGIDCNADLNGVNFNSVTAKEFVDVGITCMTAVYLVEKLASGEAVMFTDAVNETQRRMVLALTMVESGFGDRTLTDSIVNMPAEGHA